MARRFLQEPSSRKRRQIPNYLSSIQFPLHLWWKHKVSGLCIIIRQYIYIYYKFVLFPRIVRWHKSYYCKLTMFRNICFWLFHWITSQSPTCTKFVIEYGFQYFYEIPFAFPVSILRCISINITGKCIYLGESMICHFWRTTYCERQSPRSCFWMDAFLLHDNGSGTWKQSSSTTPWCLPQVTGF
jgi:hypothetical protein